MASRGWFFRVRVTLLLSVLVVVLAWAGSDWWRRRERREWRRPLRVALVLVERQPVPAAVTGELTRRARDLESQLREQLLKYGERQPHPFEIVVQGPVPASTAPPQLTEQSFTALLRHSYARFRWTSDVDERARVATRGFDSRIYLVLHPVSDAEPAGVEGESEDGGRVGIAQADIASDMVDFALFVAAHELFHTLGALDHYDEKGLAQYPSGFAAPEQKPLYPQHAAELMARNIPLSPTSARPPDTLNELWIGPETAREIGWLR